MSSTVSWGLASGSAWLTSHWEAKHRLGYPRDDQHITSCSLWRRHTACRSKSKWIIVELICCYVFLLVVQHVFVFIGKSFCDQRFRCRVVFHNFIIQQIQEKHSNSKSFNWTCNKNRNVKAEGKKNLMKTWCEEDSHKDSIHLSLKTF